MITSILIQRLGFFLYESCLRTLLCIFIFTFSFEEGNSQSYNDSIQQIRNDSVNRVPLIIQSFRADQAHLKNVLDSNYSLLQSSLQKEISLHNFFSPQFRLSNVRYSGQLYDHGINSMNYLLKGFDEYTFLWPNKPIAEISTHRGRAFSNSQASFQDNFEIHLKFAENFRNRLLWNFSYDKENYKGIYANGRQKNSLFTTGIQYTDKNDKIHFNILFLDERHNLENNWGIQSDSVFSNPNYKIRESVPVNITTAKTIISERSIGVNMDIPIFNIGKLWKPVLFLKSFYSEYSYNYTDPNTNSSQAIYQSFWIDTISINHILHQNIWTHSLTIQLLSNDIAMFELGGRYEYQIYDHDTLAVVRNVYQVKASGNYHINKSLELDGDASFKKFEQRLVPDFRVGIKLNNNNNINSKLSVFLKADPIPYIYQKLVLNKKYFWNNDFLNAFIQESGVSISLETKKYVQSRIGASWSTFSNFIYLNLNALPDKQDDINKISFQVFIPVNFKWLHFNSQLNYNKFTPDPANFSGWNSNHQLSLTQSFFKKVVNAEIGASLHVYNYKHKLQFNPIIQLYHAAEIPNELIYSVGMFMHFRVSEFQFLLDVENLDSFWNKQRPTLINRYPFYDFFLKIGIHWRFLN